MGILNKLCKLPPKRGTKSREDIFDLSLQTNLRDGDKGNERAVQRDISNYGLLRL